MTYIRNPHDQFTWDSDGVYNGKFMAKDGTLHDSPKEAIKHDKEREAAAAPGVPAAPATAEGEK